MFIIEIKSTLLLFQLQVPKERFGKERKKAKKRKTSMGERTTTDMYDPSSREDSISMFHSDNKGMYYYSLLTLRKDLQETYLVGL